MRYTNSIITISLIALLGCDLVKEDAINAEVTGKLFTLDNKPAVLNMAALSNGLDLRVVGESESEFGSIKSILDGRYVVFRPNNSFSGKTENVKLALARSNGKAFGTLNLSAKSLDNGEPCEESSGVSDYIKVKVGSGPISIDLLANDIFCGIGYNGGLIGEAALEGIKSEDFILALGPGRQAQFLYTPKPGFSGKATLIYNLGINWIAGSGYATATNEQIISNPKKYLEAFTTAMIEIEVVPE